MNVEVSDRGLLLGDGLFETLLWRDGGLVLFEAHARRMRAGCAALGLPAPAAEDLSRAVEAAVREAGLAAARAAVRLTWTAGSGGRGLDRPDEMQPRLIAAAALAPPRRGAMTLATSAVRRNEGSPASRLKTLAYLDNVLARAEAKAIGADEALMLNNRGELACAAAANLFWVKDGALFTPALDCGVLPGVTRGQVILAARRLGIDVKEVAAGLAALSGAEAAFVTNSLIGLAAVAAVDADAFRPSCEIAALLRRLGEAIEGEPPSKLGEDG